MRWIRRIHLFSGMLMLPWVLLYGITAMLFNHATWFADSDIRTLQAAPDQNSLLHAFPPAPDLAARLVHELNTTTASGNSPQSDYELVTQYTPSYSDNVSLRAKAKDVEHRIRWNLDHGTGVVETRQTKERTTPPPPFARDGDFFPQGQLITRLKGEIASLLAEHGLAADKVSIRSAPQLEFRMRGPSGEWQVQYDLSKGTVDGSPSGTPARTVSKRRFLTQLHKTHGFPDRNGPRWWWAVIVDFMFATMIFWGISGLLMCAQMKHARRIGLVLLAVGLTVAGYMSLAMYRVFIN